MSTQLFGGTRLPEPSLGDRATQVGSTQHFTGGIVLGDGPGTRTGLESHLEAQAALILAARSETRNLVEQVRFEWVDAFGDIHDHYIDLVVTEVGEKVVGYAVRPFGRAKHAYLAQLSQVKAQAVEQGVLDEFRLFTERDVCPVELYNAKLFHSVRRPDCFGDPVARDIVGHMTGVQTIAHLVDLTGLQGMGFRAVVRLIRSGYLEMVGYDRIGHHTMVFKAREI